MKIPDQGTLDASSDVLTTITNSLQTQLNKAFGTGRIAVSHNGSALSLKTTTPNGGEDVSSTLTLTTGDSDALTALKLTAGESNRLNLNAKLSGSGLSGMENAVGKSFTINGEEITIDANTTVNSLMSAINSSGAGVKVSYLAEADRFTFTATENGASGKVEISGDDAAFLNSLFGTGIDSVTSGDPIISKQGQDAVIAVKYGDSDQVVELNRDNNTFTLDGLTVTVNGAFGYGADGVTTPTANAEGVTFKANANTDSIVSAIKEMVNGYNEIVSLVNKELTTKPDRDYHPLTEEQKKEMTEDEIKLWEEKAKSGLLFGDSTLRSLSMDLRFVIGGGDMQALSEIGITTSSSYTDNGKLVLDESKLKAALESDPDAVRELFTRKSGTDSEGNAVSAGIATNLQGVMDKYVKTMGATKGLLIERAGHSSAPLSLMNNALYKEMQSIDKILSTLKDRLAAEQDRYIAQFTALESLIAQMNSQSSYLSSVSGY